MIRFRVDAGGEVGFGHIARCRSLAAFLARSGARAEWACRSDPAVWSFLGRRPEVELDERPSFEALPVREATIVSDWVAGADWLVVDHYGADDDWLRIASGHGATRTLVFDDHQRRSASLRVAPVQATAPGTLAGIEHLVLHPAFCEPPARVRRGIVISLGGADPLGLVRAVLDELPEDAPPITLLASDAVAASFGLDAVLRPGDARLGWVDPVDMPALFAAAEACLVSSSTLAFEALACATPVVALHWVDNQTLHAKWLKSHGVPVATDPSMAARMLCDGCAALGDVRVDGLGGQRIAQVMEGLACS